MNEINLLTAGDRQLAKDLVERIRKSAFVTGNTLMFDPRLAGILDEMCAAAEKHNADDPEAAAEVQAAGRFREAFDATGYTFMS